MTVCCMSPIINKEADRYLLSASVELYFSVTGFSHDSSGFAMSLASW